jgi:hypothetical protein
MFKRAFWMSTGMAVGAAGAFWAKRRVEETVERYMPEQVADRAATSARNLGAAVRGAAVEGREAMRNTEAELRARVEDRTYVGQRPAAPQPQVGRPGTTDRVRHHRRPRR